MDPRPIPPHGVREPSLLPPSPSPSLSSLSLLTLFSPSHTGVFRDKVWSEVDTASWILDQSPHTVYASGSAQIDSVQRAADLDSVAVTMTYPSGALAIIDVRRTERTSLNRVEVSV